MQQITVLAAGSRGDAQPFFALAYGMKQAGMNVRVVTNQIYEPLLHTYGLEMNAISWDPRAALLLQNEMAGEKNPFVIVREQRANTHRVFESTQYESLEACKGSDALIFSIISPWGYSIAEKLRIPCIGGALHPLEPTREFPMQMITTPLGGTLNWYSHVLAEHMLQLLAGGEVNRFRRNIGLAPTTFPDTMLAAMREKNIPIVSSLSPSIIPRPKDWPDRIHMDGYWFLPAPPQWTPPEALADFLAHDEAPIYIGFGSMVTSHPLETSQIVVETLNKIGRRGIIATGWGALVESQLDPKQFFVIKDIPHDWLFPRMSAIVHHGGAGTTASALRAGVPQIVVPHMQDQPYWGTQMQRIGVGPAPIMRGKLNVEALTKAMRSALSDHALIARAKEIGQRVRDENGLSKTMAVVKKYFEVQS